MLSKLYSANLIKPLYALTLMRSKKDMIKAREEDFPEEKPIFPTWLSKYFVRFIAGLIILLLLSFYFLNYNVIGQFVSAPVENNVLDLNDVTVVLDDDSLSAITEAYTFEVETPFCLQGTKSGLEYRVTNAYIPTIYDRSLTHVTHDRCEDTLILFHTHPFQSCLASATDINTLRLNQAIDPDIIMIIMCEENRFNLYR